MIFYTYLYTYSNSGKYCRQPAASEKERYAKLLLMTYIIYCTLI